MCGVVSASNQSRPPIVVCRVPSVYWTVGGISMSKECQLAGEQTESSDVFGSKDTTSLKVRCRRVVSSSQWNPGRSAAATLVLRAAPLEQLVPILRL